MPGKGPAVLPDEQNKQNLECCTLPQHSFFQEKRMAYTALYRKYRPDTFDEVKGQDQAVTPLRNQIISGRIGHAFMFCGTRGTGKTSVAKIFARAVNCEHPVDGNPCGECESCRAIARGASMNVIEIDAASNNGVDNIRQIRDEVAYPPTEGKYKVYIIDECHMLSGGAENALLKTLEEPPSYVIFILATTDPQKVAVTIKSRCQQYNFKRLTVPEISDRIRELLEKENVTAQEKAVQFIARKADGGMRDALSLTDQCISFYPGEELTYDKVLNVIGAVDSQELSDFLRLIIHSNVSGVFKKLDDCLQNGRDIAQIVNDLLWYLRNLMLLKASEENAAIIDVSGENLKLLMEEAALISEDTVIRYIRMLSDLTNQMRGNSNRRILTETAFVRMMRPQMKSDVSALSQRVESIERVLASGSIRISPENGPAPQVYGTEPAGSRVPAQPPIKSGEGKTGGSGQDSAYSPAAPTDLQQIKSQWHSIAQGVTSQMFRTQLERAEPMFDPTSGSAGSVYIVYPDFIGQMFMSDPKYVQELEEVIEEKIGHRVRAVMKIRQEAVLPGSSLHSIRLDDALSRLGMPVEEESDETGETGSST